MAIITNEQIIKEIERTDFVGLTKEESDEVKRVACAAIRHSIPQRPLKLVKNEHNLQLYGDCPDCGHCVMYPEDICDYCGQILDWTEPWHWDTPNTGCAISTSE